MLLGCFFLRALFHDNLVIAILCGLKPSEEACWVIGESGKDAALTSGSAWLRFPVTSYLPPTQLLKLPFPSSGNISAIDLVSCLANSGTKSQTFYSCE